MNVTVCLGEPFWRTAGRREVPMALSDGAVVGDALHELARLYPALQAELWSREAIPFIFMDEEEVRLANLVREGAVIHVVWPASGG
jgi:hypothetical protein